MSFKTFKPVIRFVVEAYEFATLAELNRLWNEMAAVAQDKHFVLDVEIAGGLQLKPVNETEALALEEYHKGAQ